MKPLIEQLYTASINLNWKYYYNDQDHKLTEAYPNTASSPFFQNILVSVSRPSRERQPLHRHEAFVLNYVYQGEVMVETAQTQLSLSSGDIYIAHPCALYTCYSAKPKEHSTILTVFIRQELLNSSFFPLIPNSDILDFFIRPGHDSQSTEYILVQGQNEDIQITLEHILREYAQKPLYYMQLVECNIATCLGLITRHHKNHRNPSSENQMQEILKYLKCNCETATLQSTACRFHYNANYFSTMIRKKTNKSFSELIQDFRLEKACTLLANSGLSVAKISKMSGYSYQATFTKPLNPDMANLRPNSADLPARAYSPGNFVYSCG